MNLCKVATDAMRPAIAFAAMLLAGCADEKRFDATSEATLESSMAEIVQDLTQDEKEEVADSLRTVILYAQRQQLAGVWDEMMDAGGPWAVNDWEPGERLPLRFAVHGLTVDGLHARAEEIKEGGPRQYPHEEAIKELMGDPVN